MMKQVAMILLSALFLLTISSCSKDDPADEIVNKGDFSISLDGTKYEGSSVINGAVIGVRTIEAANPNFVFRVIITDGLFEAGKTFDLALDKTEIAPQIVVDLDGDGTDESLWGLTGTIKVISKNKIEIDGIFYKDFIITNTPYKVTGFILSK